MCARPVADCRQRIGRGLPPIQMHGPCGLYPPYHARVVFRARQSQQLYHGETVPTHDTGSSRCEPAFYVEGINKLFLALDVQEWQLSHSLPEVQTAVAVALEACC